MIVFQLLSVADMHEEKVRILRSLGEVKNEKLIQRVLDLSLSVSSGFCLSMCSVQARSELYWLSGVSLSCRGSYLMLDRLHVVL